MDGLDRLASEYLRSLRDEFGRQRDMAERAIAQVSSADLSSRLDGEANSIAMLMQHLAGNHTSRFSDFLTTDGEKPSRDRDAEFVEGTLHGDELHAAWERGWATLEAALSGLSAADLTRLVTIRGEPLTVVRALERALAHTGYHVGQIVLLAKHLAGQRWTTLSIPRGRSRTWRPPGAR